MKWFASNLVLFGLLLGVSYLTTKALLQPFQHARTEAESRVAELSAREAALLEYLDAMPTYDSQTGVATKFVWPGNDRGAAGLQMQNELVALAESVRVRLMSFGLGSSTVPVKFPTVSFDLEIEGGHLEVSEFIRMIEDMTPPLAVSFLSLRALPPASAEGAAPVSARMTVWGFANTNPVSP